MRADTLSLVGLVVVAALLVWALWLTGRRR